MNVFIIRANLKCLFFLKKAFYNFLTIFRFLFLG